MSYLVLARKYRPQSFEDLAGQEHVAKTLANAIDSGRVAHAFLFTGVRGVGKTTSARLLAKCLNCLGKDGKAQGPTATPCQECAACKEIAAGNDMDVQEIDGASYNGVDEVRKLQEGLAFRPARDRFKIYIVDEVHMLSNAAWNAFLKTLEEPPPHVKFIFATTEVHKVPVTILSRCQRYDFKLIGTQVISKRLREVLDNEKIEAEDTAISVIAREAAGSMRDAMSLLDQVIAFSGQKLSGEDVTRVLGVADRKVLHDLTSSVLKGDAASALRVIDGVARQGFDVPHVARDLLRHFRDLVVAKVSGEGGRELLDLADEEVKDVLALAETSEIDDLTRVYQGFSRGYDDVVRSGQPRAALEVLLVRLARRPPLLPLDELLARLGDLERRLGGAPPSPPRGGGAGPTAGGRTASGGAGGGALAPGSRASGPTGIASPPPGTGAPPMASAGTSLATATAPRTAGDRALALAPEIAAPPRPMPAPPAERPREASRAPSPPSARPPKPAVAPLRGTEDPQAIAAFRAVLDRVRASRAGLAAMLEHAVPLEVGPQRVVLGYDAQSFLATQVTDAEALDLLTREVRAHFGAATEVALDLSSRPLDTSSTVANVEAAKHREAVAAARAAVGRHPLIAEIVSVFGAELKDIKVPTE